MRVNRCFPSSSACFCANVPLRQHTTPVCERPPVVGAAFPLSNRCAVFRDPLRLRADLDRGGPGHGFRTRRETMRHWITSFQLLRTGPPICVLRAESQMRRHQHERANNAHGPLRLTFSPAYVAVGWSQHIPIGRLGYRPRVGLMRVNGVLSRNPGAFCANVPLGQHTHVMRKAARCRGGLSIVEPLCGLLRPFALTRGPRSRRSRSRFPHTARDNETLDHLLSAVENRISNMWPVR